MKRFVIILFLTCACMKLQAQVNIITTIAGRDSATYCCDGEPATDAELNQPDQLWLDKFGNLYIADGLNNRVRKIVLSTGLITTVAGTGIYGYSGDGDQATNAQLLIPDGVCTDSFGNIYVCDGGNNRIRKIIVSTGIITTIVGNGTPGNTGDGGQATDAEINGPQGITIDRFGNFYFADLFNNTVRKINASGIITTIGGNGTAGYSGDGGPATDAELNAPGDVGIDSSGNIIISDEFNHAVRKVNASTGIITTIVGNGTSGYTGNGGPSALATMSHPYGVFIDKENNIFIVEFGNGVVRKIDGATGIISTVAGCGVTGFSGDGGPATDAKLRPDDVFIDNLGTMYIADFSNERIRVVYNPKLGVAPLNLSSSNVLVYPNPAQNEINVTGLQENTDYRLLSITGVIMEQGMLQQGSNTISIQNLASGIYVLEMTNSAGRINVRVTKN